MTYTRNIPISGDSLGGTRDRIRTNFQQIDTVMAVNHVAFNSSGEGKHKFVQTPDQTADVASGVNEPVLYAKSIFGTNLGVLQYSRGGSNAVPTPVTNLQSTSAPLNLAGSTALSVFDYVNIPRSMGIFMYMGKKGTDVTGSAYVIWTGTTLIAQTLSSTSGVTISVSGSILQISNNNATAMTDLYWTLDLKRTS